MIRTLHRINRLTRRHWPILLLAGLAGVIWHNWRCWQHDQALAQRLRATGQPQPVLERTPSVSALVAAWNEERHIEAHIETFLQLAYPHIELILCAGGTDETLERARRYECERIVVLRQQPGEGKQAALARCIAHASGEMIYLTDADCRYADDALFRLLAPLIHDGELAATGVSRPLDEQQGHLLPRYLWSSEVVSNARCADYCNGLLGRNALVSRRGIEQIGGLDFVARTGTDYQLAQRLQKYAIPIRHVAASVVESEYPTTLAAYRRKQSRWLRNLLIHGPRYGARRDLWATWTTVALGAAMTVAPLLACLGSTAIGLIWLLLLAHAVASKLRYTLFAAHLYQQPVPPLLLASLLPLTLIDFVVWASPLYDLLIPTRREQW